MFITSLFFKCSDKSTNPPPTHLDSTSHSFVWRVDTIGTWESHFNGVWGIDSNNVYVVGWVYLSDNDTAFTFMHWNGKNWDSMRRFIGEPQDIFGFNENDLWRVGDAGGSPNFYPKISHWNGSQWQEWEFPALLGMTTTGIWGTSSSNMFVVGWKGLILHYDGSVWSRMQSPTNSNLYDIWSANKNFSSGINIYAVGSSDYPETGILLIYKTDYWRSVFERKVKSGVPSGFMSTIWGYDNEHYFTSGGYAQLFTGYDSTWTEIQVPNTNTGIGHIRGSGWNNIFATGSFGLIIHYNGSTWKRYDEFYKKPDGEGPGKIWTNNNCVYIVGQSRDQRALVYIGKK